MTKPGTDASQSAGSSTLFYPISIVFQIFVEDSGNIKHPRNVKSIMLQLQSCYHSHLNISQKTKTNINFRSQAWVRLHAKCLVRSFILSHKYHVPNFYQRFSHALVDWKCYLVISTPSDDQLAYISPKRTFILPKNIMLQFYRYYHKNYCATWVLLEKLRYLNVL